MSEKDELDNVIKQYKLHELLQLLGTKSQEMLLKRSAMEQVVWKGNAGTFTTTFNQLMPIWALAELSYRAIINSNDHKSKSPTWDDIRRLNNLLAKVSDDVAKILSSGKTIEESKIDILLGLPNQQFWWQDVVRGGKVIYYNFIRYYLLLKIMPEFFPKLKKPNDDLIEITGFSIDDFSKLLFALQAWATKSTSVLNLEAYRAISKSVPILSPQNLNHTLSFFSDDYSYYRKPHPNNPLFFKPIIKTQSNNLIISNAFILTKKFYEGIYWLIRDKYMSLNSQDFVNAFGYYYEKYIEELLKFYLDKSKFQRIQQDGRADWIIETRKYILLVEQKSTLMSIVLKQPFPSAEKFGNFLEVFKKACIQLKKTESAMGTQGKQVIKLVLHFEPLAFKESFIKPEIAKLVQSEINSLEKFYLMQTDEFEKLIQVLSDDENIFEQIINEKIEYEKNQPSISEGQDFDDVISKFCQWKENRFLEQHKSVFDGLVQGVVF